MRAIKQCLILLVVLAISSCTNKPKQIQAVESSQSSDNSSTGIFNHSNSQTKDANQISADVHQVKIQEILPTDKYVYLRVTENDEEFWIAAPKQEVELGEVYFYKGGLLKTNFESKEYDRVFDKVFLISNLVPASHGNEQANETEEKIERAPEKVSSKNFDREGSTKIAELVSDPKKFEGKSIQLTGECSKINTNIMGRNWIHLKDGSQDDYDLVITSDLAVPVGHVVTLRGDVVLDKDFGAGYRYDIIVENAELVK